MTFNKKTKIWFIKYVGEIFEKVCHVDKGQQRTHYFLNSTLFLDFMCIRGLSAFI